MIKENLASIIDCADPTSVRSILQLVPQRILRTDHYESKLLSEDIDVRIIMLSKLLMSMSYGAELELAVSFGRCLYDLIEKRQSQFIPHPSITIERINGSIARSFSCALFDLGQLTECLQFIESARKNPHMPIGEQEDVHELIGTAIQAHVLRFEMDAAMALYEKEKPPLESIRPMGGLSLRRLIIDLFEIPQPTSPGGSAEQKQKMTHIAETSIAEQREELLKLRIYHEDNQHRMSDASLWIKEIDELLVKLETCETYTHWDHDFESDFEELFKILKETHEKLEALLTISGTETPVVCIGGMNATIIKAGVISAKRETNADEIESTLEELDQYVNWCQIHNIDYGWLMTTWSKALLFEKSKNHRKMVEMLTAILRKLTKIRRNQTQVDFKSVIGTLFPGLVPKLCQHAPSEISAEACEFRKGQFHQKNQSGDISLIQSIGTNVHYLSLVYVPETDETFACLKSDDQPWMVKPVEVSGKTAVIDRNSYCPSEWQRPSLFERKKVRAPEKYASLLDILKAPFEAGTIQEGDHICVSAESPYNMLPIHYLDFHGKPAIYKFSFSRIASFSEALTLSQRLPPKRPSEATLYFAPAREEKEIERKHRIVADLEEFLQPVMDHSYLIKNEAASIETFLEQPRTNHLIHVHAHGSYKDGKNPYKHAGILLSTQEEGLPDRSNIDPYLLSPEKLNESDVDFSLSHITLAACVSGLGGKGQGGDILGLEFALTAKGASSVLATHWDLYSSQAIAFAKLFYQKWLIDHRSKSNAYRETMIQLMNNEKDPSRALEWCAYSLFGDWR